jgi:metal-responsive CopG/Arc/MetJ family transcriptional regulator
MYVRSGMPKPDETVVISVRVTKELLKKFDRLSEQARRKRSDLARIVLEDWVAEQEKQGKK